MCVCVRAFFPSIETAKRYYRHHFFVPNVMAKTLFQSRLSEQTSSTLAKGFSMWGCQKHQNDDLWNLQTISIKSDWTILLVEEILQQLYNNVKLGSLFGLSPHYLHPFHGKRLPTYLDLLKVIFCFAPSNQSFGSIWESVRGFFPNILKNLMQIQTWRFSMAQRGRLKKSPNMSLVPKMEVTTHLYKLYGYGLCKGVFPPPK